MSEDVNAVSKVESTLASGTAAGAASHQDIRERLRNDGLQTVSKLLHESRAENKILKDKNLQLERTVDSLNMKIQKSGVSGTQSGGMGGSGDKEKEPRSPPNHSFDSEHLPSSSRQLVENLIRENNKLKHQIHNPQKIDELNLRACSLQSLNNSLKEEKGKLHQELEGLRSSINKSDNEKDKHILQLSTDLKQCRLECQQEHSHRLTLEDEIGKLNDELTDTAQRCLNMRKNLPSSVTISAPISQSHQLSDKTASISQPCSLPATASQSQVSNERFLQEQNNRLEIKCNSLEQQLRSMRGSGASAKAFERLSAENNALKEQLADRDKQVGRLKEHCQMLSHQLQVYQDDFKKERHEREKLLKDYSYLEEHVKELKVQLIKASPANNAWDGRQQAASRPRAGQQAVRFSMQPSRSQTNKDHQPKSGSKGGQARPVQAAPSKPLDKEDTISLSSQTDVVRPTLPAKQQADLACYKCDKRFGLDKHSDLIDHLDVCTGT